MRFMSCMVMLVLAASAPAQEKSASALTDIIDCVRTKSCKNATASTTSWADTGGIQVQVFKDGQSSYSVALSGDSLLNIWLTLAGESKPGMITVGADGRVLGAELGPQPGESFPMRMTPEQTAQKRALRKAYRSTEYPSKSIGSWGEEHRSFWQQQADAAVAAIRRTLSR